jgi:DNA-directed RNA polymerase specialized sigma24 family protein
VYAAWYDREVRPLPVDDNYVDDGRYDARPDEQAEASVLIGKMLDRDPDLCRALQLQSEGYSLEEIALMVGTTPAAVRSQFHRGRRRLGKEGLE